MEQYEKLKDSGIEWIGKVPEHWSLKKFGQVSYMKGRIGWQGLNQAEFTQNSEAPFLITGMNFHSGIIRWDEVYHITEERYEQAPEIQLKNLDVLITKDGTIGKLLFVDEIPYPYKASLNSHLLVLRPLDDSYYPKYLYYQLQSLPFLHHIELTKTGTTFFGITQEAMGRYKMILPSKDEQINIATYLDCKITEIESIIANKRKLIALYEEEKQAVINQAITKGLDPNVKLKDSGVEWLGDIPELWDVKKLNYCFGQIGSGTTPTSGKTEYYENGEFNWLQTGDLNDSEIVETSKKITQKALDEFTTLRFYPIDSIVIAMYGATIGKTGILKIVTTTNQACCVLSKPQKMFPKFVFYWFSSVKKHIISISYGGGQPNINQEQIRSLKIQQPTIDEQQSIVSHIEKECHRLDAIIEKFNKQIDLLQEYRTTLISDVVTGKIKVIN